jgi:hypothetical protein
MHFLPYAWLQRTRAYLVLGGVLSLGAFALQMFLGALAFNVILFFVSAVYWVAAVIVYREARRLVAGPQAVAV